MCARQMCDFVLHLQLKLRFLAAISSGVGILRSCKEIITLEVADGILLVVLRLECRLE